MLVDVMQLIFWVVLGIAAVIILYHLWCFLRDESCFSSSECNTKNNKKTIVKLVEPSSCTTNCNRKKKWCRPMKHCFYTTPPPPPPPPPPPSDEDEPCYCQCRSRC